MKRLQFDIPDDKYIFIEKLMVKGKFKTKKDMFNTAIFFLDWALNERINRRIIASMNENTKKPSYREIIIPAFFNLEIKKFSLEY